MAVFAAMMTYSFRLYVVGQTPRSLTAQANLRRLCDSYVPGCNEIEVIDVADRPILAEEERILATPTVIRISPLPRFRVIGDLSDQATAAAFLGLPDRNGTSREGRAR